MTKFTKEDLDSLQKLAKIQLSTEEEKTVLGNIKDILHYMEMLDEVDTSNTLPCTYVTKGMKAPLAEDEVSDHLKTEEFLDRAPARVGSFLRVPAVIEDKEEI